MYFIRECAVHEMWITVSASTSEMEFHRIVD